MKKKWTKETFTEACNEQMANITDPKRRAAKRCQKNARRYKAIERKKNPRRPRDA